MLSHHGAWPCALWFRVLDGHPGANLWGVLRKGGQMGQNSNLKNEKKSSVVRLWCLLPFSTPSAPLLVACESGCNFVCMAKGPAPQPPCAGRAPPLCWLGEMLGLHDHQSCCACKLLSQCHRFDAKAKPHPPSRRRPPPPCAGPRKGAPHLPPPPAAHRGAIVAVACGPQRH